MVTFSVYLTLVAGMLCSLLPRNTFFLAALLLRLCKLWTQKFFLALTFHNPRIKTSTNFVAICQILPNKMAHGLSNTLKGGRMSEHAFAR